MQIEPIYPKSMTCLYCKHPFKTSRVRSRFVRVSSHDTDFKPNYKNLEANPLYYNVAVCPSCGFAFTEDFLPYFAPHAEQKIEKIIRANWNKRDLTGERTIEDAIETYKLALLSSKLKEEKALPTAGLALRLAWLYRELGDKENEIRFLTASRDAYKEAFTAGDHAGTTMSETRVVYLIAELSWRIGDKDEAIRNFSYIISNQKNSTDPKAVNLAKERWQEIRELDENKSE